MRRIREDRAALARAGVGLFSMLAIVALGIGVIVVGTRDGWFPDTKDARNAVAGVMLAALFAVLIVLAVAEARRTERELARFRAWLGANGFDRDAPLAIATGAKGGLVGLPESRAAAVPDLPIIPFKGRTTARMDEAGARAGARGRVSVMDYRLEVPGSGRGGKLPVMDRYTLVVVDRLGPLPLAWIEPQKGPSKLGVALGGRDVDVESAEFNRLWRVYGFDDAEVHAVLTPRVIDRLLQPDAAGLTVTTYPGMVLIMRPGAASDAWLDAAVSVAEDVAQALPLHLGAP